MSDGPRSLGSYRRFAMALLAAGMVFSTVGCSSVPDIPDGAFDRIGNLGPGVGQQEFEQQVQNDPFPTAGEVGL